MHCVEPHVAATSYTASERESASLYSSCCYRPQRSWAKVMFLQESVILLTGGVSASMHAGIPIHPPGSRPPPGADPPWSRHPPGNRHPLEQTPLEQTPLGSRHTPQSRHPPPGSRHPWSRHPQGADTHPQIRYPQSRHPPPGSRHPPSRHPPGADLPEQTLSPQEQTPAREQTSPREQTPPPRKADSSIRSTSDRYASYWNAILVRF